MTLTRSRLIMALAMIAVLGLIVFGLIAGLQRSRTLLEARVALAPSPVRVIRTPEVEARGERLVAVAACSGCHGTTLIGGPLNVMGTQYYTPNLTRVVSRLSDAEIDRALRQGVRPDGTSELVMPAHAYSAMTDDEVGAIIAYLRTLPAKGIDLPQSRPGPLLRAALAVGSFHLEPVQVSTARRAVQVGPRFEAGRHLAAIACGRCHGSDLGGVADVGTDMTVRGYYDRAHFHALIQKGEAIGEGNMALMTRTAQANFSHFTDGEVDAIYDYLNARDRVLAAQAAARKSAKPSG